MEKIKKAKQQKIFIGKYKATVDGKHRIVVPAKWKSMLTGEIVIQKGYDGCVELRTKQEYEIFVKEIINSAHTAKNNRIKKRSWLGGAQTINIDSWSKFVIPSQSIKDANLGKEIYLVGLGNVIEVWDAEIYDAWILNNEGSVEESIADDTQQSK